ncbi:hypothetical protein X777_01128, partial [Ooceraea biroi]
RKENREWRELTEGTATSREEAANRTSTSSRKELTSDTCATSLCDSRAIGKASRQRVGKSDVHTMPVLYRARRKSERGRERETKRERERREKKEKDRGKKEEDRAKPPRKSCGGVPADGPGPTRSIYPFFESAFSLFPLLSCHSLSVLSPFRTCFTWFRSRAREFRFTLEDARRGRQRRFFVLP